MKCQYSVSMVHPSPLILKSHGTASRQLAEVEAKVPVMKIGYVSN